MDPSQTTGPTGTPAPLNSNGAANPVSVAPSQQPIYFNVTTPSTTTNDANADQRIRDLMSQKDKAHAELAKTQQDVLTLQGELTKYKETVQGATDATRQLLEQKVALEREREQYRAEALKLQKLAQAPELLPYEKFIPATTDEAVLQAAIEQFKLLRDQDLARVAKPIDPAQGPRALYPTTNVPPAQPAGGAPNAGDPQASLRSFEDKVRAAGFIADPAQREMEMIKLRDEAATLARAQWRV